MLARLRASAGPISPSPAPAIDPTARRRASSVPVPVEVHPTRRVHWNVRRREKASDRLFFERTSGAPKTIPTPPLCGSFRGIQDSLDSEAVSLRKISSLEPSLSRFLRNMTQKLREMTTFSRVLTRFLRGVTTCLRARRRAPHRHRFVLPFSSHCSECLLASNAGDSCPGQLGIREKLDVASLSMRIALAGGKSTNILSMNIAHIYHALSCPTPPAHLARAGSPFATASALALLIQIENVPLLALSYSASDLQTRFPSHEVPLCAQKFFKLELTRYQAWRRTLFDLFLLETGSFADQDLIAGLERIVRLQFKRRTNELYALRHALPPTVEIKDLTPSSALQIDRHLDGPLRQSYRAALGLLDRLQDAPLAAGSRHFLPAEIIGRLPPPTGHLYHAPLPPKLDAVYSVAPSRVRAAVPFLYRLSLIAEILSPDLDPSFNDFAEKCLSLWNVDPQEHGFQKPSQVALQSYIRRIGLHAGADYAPPTPVQATVPQAWTDLRSLMRQRGFQKMIQRTFGVSAHAIRTGISPAKMTPEWIQETLQVLPRQERNAFRSGIFVLDELIQHKEFPQDVLPREVSGLTRMREPRRT